MPKKYKKLDDGYYRHRETYQGVEIDLRAKDASELDEKVREKKNSIDRGEIAGANAGTTVAAWCEEWLETYKKPYVVKNTYTSYVGYVNKYIKPAIGKIKIKDVRQSDLQKILFSQEGGSFSRVSKLRITICSIFKSAYINRIIYFDPSVGLKLPNYENGTHRVITSGEKRTLEKVCEVHPHGLFPMLILYCGLRPGECAVLRRKNVDLKKREIRIECALEGNSKIIKLPKTLSGIRTVPIPDEAFPAVSATVSKIGDGEAFVFDVNGTHPTDQTLKRWWKSIRRAMNIELGAKMYRNQIKPEDELVAEDFTPYCLRHTYCTMLQDAGIPLNVAKELMGHKNVTVTANIYTHQTELQRTDAKKTIDAHFARLNSRERKRLNNRKKWGALRGVKKGCRVFRRKY